MSQSFATISIRCPDHPNGIIVEDVKAGDSICSECGLVIGDRAVDLGGEWRVYSNDVGKADQSRVGGAENLLLDGGLTTLIGGDPATSETIKGYTRSNYATSKSDNALMVAIHEITTVAERANIPKMVVDRATYLYKRFQDKTKVIPSRVIGATACACLYIACRQENVPRTFKEICNVSKFPKKEITRRFRNILNTLEMTLDQAPLHRYTDRFCSNLGLPKSVNEAANAIANAAMLMDLVEGRSPVVIASAAIYMASQVSNMQRSIYEIGRLTGVTEGSINQVYRCMYPKAEKLFPKDFEFIRPIKFLPI